MIMRWHTFRIFYIHIPLSLFIRTGTKTYFIFSTNVIQDVVYGEKNIEKLKVQTYYNTYMHACDLDEGAKAFFPLYNNDPVSYFVYIYYTWWSCCILLINNKARDTQWLWRCVVWMFYFLRKWQNQLLSHFMTTWTTRKSIVKVSGKWILH